MLKNDFYFVSAEQSAEGQYQAVISFDSGHRIFAGHFPGQPVVPGVCMLQIVKESLEGHLVIQLDLIEASALKFLKVIDPQITPVVNLQLKYRKNEEGNFITDAELFNDESIYFKMKGKFSSEKDQPGN